MSPMPFRPRRPRVWRLLPRVCRHANTYFCHHSHHCHHCRHPGRQVPSVFPVTSTVVIILIIQDDKTSTIAIIVVIQDDKYKLRWKNSCDMSHSWNGIVRQVWLKSVFTSFLQRAKYKMFSNPSCQASSVFLAAMGYVQIVYQSLLPGSSLGKLS